MATESEVWPPRARCTVSAPPCSSVGISAATLLRCGGSDTAARHSSRTRTARRRGPQSTPWTPADAARGRRASWREFQRGGAEMFAELAIERSYAHRGVVRDGLQVECVECVLFHPGDRRLQRVDG